MLKLKARGLIEESIKAIGYRLTLLAAHVDLDEPDSVNDFIANLKTANSYKMTLVKAYGYYVKAYGLAWVKPKFRCERRLPKTPTIEAIAKIVAAANQRFALIFKLLAETGAMPHELHAVTLRDIDLDRGTINIPGFKGHLSRVHKLKPDTVAMLKTYINKNHDAQNAQVFPRTFLIGRAFRKYRNRMTDKLKDPSLRQIRLYDLRHYFGTMTYYKTKDILYTKQQLGHKKIETTLIYTQLVDFGEEEWTSAVAKSVEEACKLVDAGFEYVCNFEGAMIFRKRK